MASSGIQATTFIWPAHGGKRAMRERPRRLGRTG